MLEQESLDAALKQIDAEVKEHPVILYMKGTRLMPQCGFSAQVVYLLDTSGVDYTTRNVLEDDARRQAIKEYSDWPTIPQLYIRGEFIGGCDIVKQLQEDGELKGLLKGEG